MFKGEIVLLVYGPLRDAIIISIIILLVTILLKKLKVSRCFVNVPGILGMLGALGLLYWSYEFVRGFEGMGIAFLSFFLIMFLIPSLIIANEK